MAEQKDDMSIKERIVIALHGPDGKLKETRTIGKEESDDDGEGPRVS